jgi:hypothetical protein
VLEIAIFFTLGLIIGGIGNYAYSDFLTKYKLRYVMYWVIAINIIIFLLSSSAPWQLSLIRLVVSIIPAALVVKRPRYNKNIWVLVAKKARQVFFCKSLFFNRLSILISLVAVAIINHPIINEIDRVIPYSLYSSEIPQIIFNLMKLTLIPFLLIYVFLIRILTWLEKGYKLDFGKNIKDEDK